MFHSTHSIRCARNFSTWIQSLQKMQAKSLKEPITHAIISNMLWNLGGHCALMVHLLHSIVVTVWETSSGSNISITASFPFPSSTGVLFYVWFSHRCMSISVMFSESCFFSIIYVQTLHVSGFPFPSKPIKLSSSEPLCSSFFAFQPCHTWQLATRSGDTVSLRKLSKMWLLYGWLK